ncbi:MAG: hypothetical protein QF577_06575 [Phycisphaerae bacterium]|nr:hypothetical protein [Phycisphaerae bacterium]
MADNGTIKLAMVNDVMRRCGKLPVSALDTGGQSSPGLVERTIDDAISEILSKGWYFNRRYNVESTADGDGLHQLSALEANLGTIYSIDTDATDAYIPITVTHHTDGETDTRVLYNLDDKTDEWGADATLRVAFIYRSDVQDLPEQFKKWIISLSAFNHNRHFLQNEARDGQLQQEMMYSQACANREEIEVADVNVLDTPEQDQIRGRHRKKNRSSH